ncbi:hypothetical protein ATANTOWER_022048 [Ataeniobius toweri]|uniref:Uncharacterized protein n=1 Tax=Ataeniobius toweri TaxID=208326 RepID=A0ABU7B1F8_9TELE|nr:hypothetical protein [Ataeniobius toweri]
MYNKNKTLVLGCCQAGLTGRSSLLLMPLQGVACRYKTRTCPCPNTLWSDFAADMSNFLSNALGNDGVAKMAGQKAGQFVEQTVKNAMGGGAGKGGQQQENKKEGGEGGFDVEDVLSLAGGKKNEGGGGGLDVSNFTGGLFK